MWTCSWCLIGCSCWCLVWSRTLRWRWSLILVRWCHWTDLLLLLLWRNWLIWRNAVVVSWGWLLLNYIIIGRVARYHVKCSLELRLFLLLLLGCVIMIRCVLRFDKIKCKSAHCAKCVVCHGDIRSKQWRRCFRDLVLLSHLVLRVWKLLWLNRCILHLLFLLIISSIQLLGSSSTSTYWRCFLWINWKFPYEFGVLSCTISFKRLTFIVTEHCLCLEASVMNQIQPYCVFLEHLNAQLHFVQQNLAITFKLVILLQLRSLCSKITQSF